VTLTDGEVQSLILALADARGERGFQVNEVKKVVAWAERVRMEDVMLRLILEGQVWVDVVGSGEVVLMAKPKDEEFS
jgi:hypothetical protein